jgi:biofilm PGA synthesis N-glycosyltransferase PgaC
MIMQIIAWAILILGTVNLIRLMVLMVGTDVHDVRRSKSAAATRYRPKISVIIPAYNEELGITRCLDSLAANTYANKEILVINDGSSDATAARVRAWKRRKANRQVTLRLINQKNAGKASAINNGLQRAAGSLIMVLDADSTLAPNALAEIPRYFADKRVALLAANVKIIEDGSIFSLVQKYEYLISYRLKKSLSAYNMEYIIGGVGSTFRRSTIKRVGSYDTDTITEDIDYTLKVLSQGNVKTRLNYAPTVHAYTESVMSFGDLIKQRFRWKYGRMQAFLKNRHLFFNRDAKYDRRLTMFQLPYALWAEVMFGLEPFLIAYIFLVVYTYHDLSTLLSVYLVTSTYIGLNILFDDSETTGSKLRLLPLTLIQYPLFFILSAVEYAALIKSLARIHQLRSSLGHGSWEHVARAGAPR